jgi:S-adenosylmethionine synthetase
VFTSESVSEGHPDKICDRISDAIVDTYLAAEPQARCGVETLVTTNQVVLAGETRGPASVTKDKLVDVARQAIRDIGYEQDNFHWQKADVLCVIHGQSSDIAQGVDAAGNKDEGAGDQGMMFGYACDETPDLMPAPIYYAHGILRALSEARHAGRTPLLGPDSKSQVTLQYEDGKPVCATKVVVSIQHDDGIDADQVREIVRPYVTGTLPAGWMCDEANFLVNPTGRFVIGGPDGDAGVTGRKIIVDTYGGARRMAAAPFRARTPPRSTAPRHTPRATSRRTSSGRGSPRAARSRSPTRSGWPSRCRSMSIPRRATSTRPSSAASCRNWSTSRRAASAPISGSTSRSTPAPRLTAISDASPTPMAASRGNASTSSTNCAALSRNNDRQVPAPHSALVAIAWRGRDPRL